MAIDPICKMEVDETTAKFTSEYKGKTYYLLRPEIYWATQGEKTRHKR